MKRWLVLGLIGCGGWGVACAEEASFSKTVRPGDFSAAGLAKLSPAELARLDALVRDFKRGVTTVAATAMPAPTSATAAAATEKKSESSLLARAKVLLTPGTEIEYTTVESRIAGDFRGWEGKTIFTLEDGARWQVANGGSYFTPPIASPKVKIVPATMGGFWMMIEGVNQRVRVVRLGGGK